jgi:hypothetical protein
MISYSQWNLKKSMDVLYLDYEFTKSELDKLWEIHDTIVKRLVKEKRKPSQ